MKTDKEYIQDLSEIRLIMERSTKFVSLSGLSGILAGIYALAGAYIAHRFFYNGTGDLSYTSLARQEVTGSILEPLLLGAILLLLAVGTAVFLSSKNAKKNKEALRNPVAQRLVIHMAIPLVTGGIFILIMIAKGILGWIAPVTLIFYGLALINGSKFTFDEIRYLGITQIVLGLTAAYFTEYGLLLWAVGFGFMHIAYGTYMHFKYEK
jgi:hypothetical protein